MSTTSTFAPGGESLITLMERVNQEMGVVLTSFRQTRAMLEQTSVRQLQHTTDKLGEVTSATESAATDLLDGLDQANQLLDRMDDEATRGDENARSATSNEMRDLFFHLMGALQFQDITAQQISYASAVIADTENRILELARLLDPNFTVEAIAPEEIRERVTGATFDPLATTGEAVSRQSLVDSIFGR